MIDLFYPPSPQHYRHGRLVTQEPMEAPQRVRPKGRDPEKNRRRQARYRARMRLDPVRYERKLAQNRAYHQAHREEELAKMKARRDAKKTEGHRQGGGQ